MARSRGCEMAAAEAHLEEDLFKATQLVKGFGPLDEEDISELGDYPEDEEVHYIFKPPQRQFYRSNLLPKLKV